MNNAAPFVTVAMITYNHADLIAEAISSILEQTYDNFELVIVDDGSTDGTGDVIRRFTDPRIRHVCQENQGPSEARNTALRLARGTVIAQMSGDDVAESIRLERQIKSYLEHPTAVVFSHCTFIGDSGATIECPALDARINRPNWSREVTLRHLFLMGNCFLAPSALSGKANFDDVGQYKPELLQLQDYDMWVRFLLRGYEVIVLQEPLVRYRLRANGGNLTSARGAPNRVNFERRRVMREFLAIDDARLLLSIFPEIRSFGYPIDDGLSAFLLAMVALQDEFRGQITRAFGADLLMDLMENPETRRMLLASAGFRNADLFRILGDVSFRDAEGLQAQIDNMLGSRTWRAAASLRRVAAWLRSLG